MAVWAPRAAGQSDRRKLRHAGSGAALVGVVVAACVYDSGDRCDPGQVLFADTRCICAPGLVLGEAGCVPCGEHEVAGATGCVCEAGYARASAESACAEKPVGQGEACDDTLTPCADPLYDHCQVGSGTNGYCTSTGCSSAADCAGGYACDTSTAPSFCKRPPVGEGTPCTSSADCAETEATYCETFMSHVCLVQGCTLDPNDCFDGTECCDFSAFGLPRLCVPPGACP